MINIFVYQYDRENKYSLKPNNTVYIEQFVRLEYIPVFTRLPDERPLRYDDGILAQ